MAVSPIDRQPDAHQPRGRRLIGWRLLVAMAAVAVVGFGWVDALAVISVRPSPATTDVLSALVHAALAIWGGLLVLRAVAGLPVRERVAWVTLTCGVLTWSFASLLGASLTIAGLGADAAVFTAVFTAVFAANVMLVLAVALLPPSPSRPSRSRRIDTAIMATAATCLVWSLRVDRAPDATTSSGVLDVGFDAPTVYTVLNLLAIVVAIAALTRCRPDRRGEIVPVATALVVASIGDVILQSASAGDDRIGQQTAGALYLVALALFVVVGRRLVAPVGPDEMRTERGLRSLPELATLAALAVLAVRQRIDQGPATMTVVLGTTLVLLAIVRLGQLEREQRVLARSLEGVARRLRSEARTDRLTGLGNRVALDDRLQLAVERQLGSNAPGELSVFYIDLDHFKRINDGLGHQVGDELLIEVARRLQTVMGQDVFRVGGDEFVAFREHPDSSTPESMANAVIRALRTPIIVGGHELNIAVSVGLVTRRLAPTDDVELGRPVDAAARLLRQADLALYQAKDLGRGRLARYDPHLQRRADQRLALQQGLHRGLVAGEMEVHYRPVVDLFDGTVAGAQAYLRWRSPEHGLLTPRSFIEAASDASLLPQLDSLVFDDVTAALRTSAALHSDAAAAGAPMWISTRLSRAELNHPALLELVAGVLHSTESDPERLRIEVSEDTIVDTVTLEVLGSLRQMGVHLTVAAFGTGPSSLIRLNRYPASTIKVDRSFVEGLGRRPNDTLVVSTVAELAGDLGLELAADGVTEEFQLQMLHELGFRYAQGRFVGRASPRAEFFGHHIHPVGIDSGARP